MHLYRHHAIQFTGCNEDILQLINIEKQVNVHIDRGYDVLRDLFNAGLNRRKEVLEAEEERYMTMELIMQYRHVLLQSKKRVQYFVDRLNEIDEKFDCIDRFGQVEDTHKLRRLQYLLRNYNIHFGHDFAFTYVNIEGQESILRYDQYYDNFLFD